MAIFKIVTKSFGIARVMTVPQTHQKREFTSLPNSSSKQLKMEQVFSAPTENTNTYRIESYSVIEETV